MEEITSAETCPACGFSPDGEPESLLHLPPGTLLQDRYLLGRALGQGGFGITYLGWDTTLNLKLAIKEYLPQQLATRSKSGDSVTVYKATLTQEFNYGRAKFLEEARTLARFNEHPNIVTVRDYFEANNTAYLVMNHIEGLTLQNYLESQGGKIPADQAINIFMPVLDALKEVHASGVLHRDISPDNLLINTAGRVILIDFGAARQAMGEKSKSLSVIMKAGYSPEEQYRSRGKQGPWTDIYAVAATIYRTISGQAPPEAMDRLAQDGLIGFSQQAVTIGLEQEQALLKALAVKAADRYQSVEEFQAALGGPQPEQSAESKGEHKACPYCGEEIKAAALKCRYCREMLTEVPVSTPVRKMTDGPKIIYHGTSQAGDKVLSGDGCPVEIVSSSVEVPRGENKAFAVVIFRNLADKTVAALKLELKCFDAFDEPVTVNGNNVFEKKLQDLEAGKGVLFGREDAFELQGLADTRRVEVQVLSAVFKDGTRWEHGISRAEVLKMADIKKMLTAAGDAKLYYISRHGNTPLIKVPTGSIVVDPSWQWEFRTGSDYSGNGEKKAVFWLVVAKDHYESMEPHVTLLSAELIGRYAFDKSTSVKDLGYNHWGESGTHSSAGRGLRPWLNSTSILEQKGFYQSFSDSFKQVVLTTTLPNREWLSGVTYITEDRVFIPSTTELGDAENAGTYEIGLPYPYFREQDNAKRVAALCDEVQWYWTRSPDSVNKSSISYVHSKGEFYNGGFAYYSYGGVRPALNLKAETLVSEIRG